MILVKKIVMKYCCFNLIHKIIFYGGDSGVGNFFISKEDLKNKDFSHVRYYWDCY
ncbi:DUF1963 domain-containing protein [Faecalibacillus intestinalis]|uniref:DUF1963 domain-containing protein n=1 Tax=Faecalibacillus intestinalis TaxID=1982626 RepID=UPI000BDF58D9